MAKVGIHIVTYNGLRYLPELFSSIAQQTYQDTIVRIWDNASTDGTREWLATYARRFFANVELTLSNKNTFFVGGHNQLYARALEPFIQLVNQDTVLDRSYIEHMVEHMETHPRVGSSAGLLMTWEHRNADHAYIDSAGICAHRCRKYTEYKSGEKIEKAQLDHWPKAIEVWGVSGTLPMYRTQAIKQVASADELFDPLFEMYKEDVDLAIRLRKAGWTAYCVSAARAYHDRTVSQHTDRSTRSFAARYRSYRNHLYLLFKHETWHTFITDMFDIVPHELAKAAYLLCYEPRVLGAWREVWKNRKKICAKKEKRRKTDEVFSISHKHLAATDI